MPVLVFFFSILGPFSAAQVFLPLKFGMGAVVTLYQPVFIKGIYSAFCLCLHRKNMGKNGAQMEGMFSLYMCYED